MSRSSRFDIYLPEIIKIYNGTTKSIKLISSKFGISESWVYEYLHRRGAREKRKYMKSWTKENDERLIELLSKYDRKTTALKLGFTEKAIRSRVRRLGLTETKCRADWYTLTEVCLLLGVSPSTMLNKIKDGRLKASGYNGNETVNKSCWMISRDDIFKYIITYPRDLEGKHVDIAFIIDIVAEYSK